MKKMIVAILIAMMGIVSNLSGAVYGDVKPIKNKVAFFMQGKSVVYVYPTIETKNISKDKVETLKKYMQSNVCDNKDTKSVLDAGYSIIWVYTKDPKHIVVLTLTNCN